MGQSGGTDQVGAIRWGQSGGAKQVGAKQVGPIRWGQSGGANRVGPIRWGQVGGRHSDGSGSAPFRACAGAGHTLVENKNEEDFHGLRCQLEELCMTQVGKVAPPIYPLPIQLLDRAVTVHRNPEDRHPEPLDRGDKSIIDKRHRVSLRVLYLRQLDSKSESSKVRGPPCDPPCDPPCELPPLLGSAACAEPLTLYNPSPLVDPPVEPPADPPPGVVATGLTGADAEIVSVYPTPS
eukprot:750995-Prorocentrum_minimum.AAC.4